MSNPPHLNGNRSDYINGNRAAIVQLIHAAIRQARTESPLKDYYDASRLIKSIEVDTNRLRQLDTAATSVISEKVSTVRHELSGMVIDLEDKCLDVEREIVVRHGGRWDEDWLPPGV